LRRRGSVRENSSCTASKLRVRTRLACLRATMARLRRREGAVMLNGESEGVLVAAFQNEREEETRD